MLTLTDAPAMMVDEVVERENTPLGHVSKKTTVGVDKDGVPIGSPNRIDDHAKSTMEDPLGRNEMKRQSLTETPSRKVVDNQHNQ